MLSKATVVDMGQLGGAVSFEERMKRIALSKSRQDPVRGSHEAPRVSIWILLFS